VYLDAETGCLMIVNGVIRGNGIEMECLVCIHTVSAYSRAHQFSVLEVRRRIPDGTYQLGALGHHVYVRHEGGKWTDGVAWIEAPPPSSHAA
jgi:hypothetical protein